MIRKIRFHVFKWFAPYMVGRYRTHNGKLLPRTRISNTTYIGNPENLNIEDNVFIGHFNFIDASNGMLIKTGCQITNYISIVTHSSHIAIRLYGNEYNKVSNHLGYVRGSVEIGAYSFIGPHSVIMPSTKIGKGCIVAAYSYVKGEFPDFSIIVGNPAKVVGDTRKLDEEYLKSNPDLASFYKEWTSR